LDGRPRTRTSLRADKEPRPPKTSSARVTAVMRANRAVNTGPERSLRRALSDLGLSGYRIAPRTVPGRPDIAFTRFRVAIFVHGCFWHHHACVAGSRSLPKTHVEYWRLKFRLNRARDARKLSVLRGGGWKTLVIWECQLGQNPIASAIKVSRLVRDARRKMGSQALHTPRVTGAGRVGVR
jgi:DNA mismatch endonuclease, patch repair protein